MSIYYSNHNIANDYCDKCQNYYVSFEVPIDKVDLEGDVYKRQLEQLLVNTTACARYKNKRLQALKILYDSCIRQNITDIGMLEIEQFESICTDFRKPGNESLGYQLSIIAVSYTHLDVYKRQVLTSHQGEKRWKQQKEVG